MILPACKHCSAEQLTCASTKTSVNGEGHFRHGRLGLETHGNSGHLTSSYFRSLFEQTQDRERDRSSQRATYKGIKRPLQAQAQRSTPETKSVPVNYASPFSTIFGPRSLPSFTLTADRWPSGPANLTMDPQAEATIHR